MFKPDATHGLKTRPCSPDKAMRVLPKISRLLEILRDTMVYPDFPAIPAGMGERKRKRKHKKQRGRIHAMPRSRQEKKPKKPKPFVFCCLIGLCLRSVCISSKAFDRVLEPDSVYFILDRFFFLNSFSQLLLSSSSSSNHSCDVSLSLRAVWLFGHAPW